MPIVPGQTLGNYRIVEQVGRGGMATVYKAYQASLSRHVAIKVLPAFYAEEPAFLERFHQEAITVANLRHPNIPAVHDSGEEDGTTYIVTEYVDGGTLADHLGEPITPSGCVAILRPIASALDYAHGRGVIHRDIKPSNVLLTKEGTPLLSDFGIARIVSDARGITRTGVSVGTPEYMAPEQAMHSHVGPAADIYALAVMAYEMLTGRVPFSAETPMAVILAHLHSPLPLPRERNPSLSEPIQDVLLKGLAKKPEDRHRAAGEFVTALEAAVALTEGPDATAANVQTAIAQHLQAHNPPTATLASTPAPMTSVPAGAAPMHDATVAGTPSSVPVVAPDPMTPRDATVPGTPMPMSIVSEEASPPLDATLSGAPRTSPAPPEAPSNVLHADVDASNAPSESVQPRLAPSPTRRALPVGLIAGIALGITALAAGGVALVVSRAGVATVPPSQPTSAAIQSIEVGATPPPSLPSVCLDPDASLAEARAALAEGAAARAREILAGLGECPGVDVRAQIAPIDLLLTAREAQARGDPEGALRVARQLARTHPQFPGLRDTTYAALVAIGRVALDSGDALRALDLCTEAAALRPNGEEAAACATEAQPTLTPVPAVQPTARPAPTTARPDQAPAPAPLPPTATLRPLEAPRAAPTATLRPLQPPVR